MWRSSRGVGLPATRTRTVGRRDQEDFAATDASVIDGRHWNGRLGDMHVTRNMTSQKTRRSKLVQRWCRGGGFEDLVESTRTDGKLDAGPKKIGPARLTQFSEILKPGRLRRCISN